MNPRISKQCILCYIYICNYVRKRQIEKHSTLFQTLESPIFSPVYCTSVPLITSLNYIYKSQPFHSIPFLYIFPHFT